MLSAEYLRRQAETCLRIARTCFDLASAERMRLMASELKTKANEIEKRDAIAPHMIGRNGSFNGSNRRD